MTDPGVAAVGFWSVTELTEIARGRRFAAPAAGYGSVMNVPAAASTPSLLQIPVRYAAAP